MGSAIIKYDKKTNNYYFSLPDEMWDKLGWRVGDKIDWINNNDGSYTLSKIEENTTTHGGKTTTVNFRCS